MKATGFLSNDKSGALWLLALLSFFFFQLLTDFIEAIYAFALLKTSLTIEIASIVFLFSPALTSFLPVRRDRRMQMLLAGLVILTGAVTPLLDTRGRMLVAGLGAGSFLLLLSGWLAGEPLRSPFWLPGAGLASGILLAVLVRSLNSGNDLVAVPTYFPLGVVLALSAGVLLVLWGSLQSRNPHSAESPTGQPVSFARLAGLSLGVYGVLALFYLAFASPHILARWTGASIEFVILLSVLSLVVFISWWTGSNRSPRPLRSVWVEAWNLVFLASLVLTILPYQLKFPAQPDAYPLPGANVPWMATIPLALTLLLYPVLFLDFNLYTQALQAAQPAERRLAGAFSLGSLFLLIMVFAQVFTTTYDYIPVVGPMFRDRFWLVYLLAGLVAILPLGLLNREVFMHPQGSYSAGRQRFLLLVAVLAALGAILLTFITGARPGPVPGKSWLRVVTYNIQQGYSQSGQKNFTGQLDLLRRTEADVIGLQETDTSRIAGGNSDVVRYFADQLNMYSYYGPTTVTGTFGIALLSKYPLNDPHTFFMYSRGEQTAAIQAEINVSGVTYHLLVTHLGNGGPLIQQQQVLQKLSGLTNVIAMGDFNFNPSTPQYQLTTQSLADAWQAGGAREIHAASSDSAEVTKNKYIDHIFISPGMPASNAQYILSPQSDHPALMVDIQP